MKNQESDLGNFSLLDLQKLHVMGQKNIEREIKAYNNI